MAGRHEGQCIDPQTITDVQRQALIAWIAAVGISPRGRAILVRATGCQSGSIADLSEKQAGDALEAVYEMSRPKVLP